MSDEELSSHDIYRRQRELQELKRQRRRQAAQSSTVAAQGSVTAGSVAAGSVAGSAQDSAAVNVKKKRSMKPSAVPVVIVQRSLEAHDGFATLDMLKNFVDQPKSSILPPPLSEQTILDVLVDVMQQEESLPILNVSSETTAEFDVSNGNHTGTQEVAGNVNSGSAIQTEHQHTSIASVSLEVSVSAPAFVPTLAPAFVPVNRMSVFLKAFRPWKLETMFGQDLAIRKVLDWYQTKKWKHEPCVLWGPCGVGKTLLCNLVAKKFRANFVTFEDELDVLDKLKGWLQSATSKGVGLLAFTEEIDDHLPSWMLIDDFDSLEGQCRKDVIPLLKKYMKKNGPCFPGPVFLTCYNLHDKHMAALKAMQITVPLKLHMVENLKKLVRTVDSLIPEEQVALVAASACGDARKLLTEARFVSIQKQVGFNQREKEPALYHSPFVAAQAIVRKPEIHSRALDGQEFLVQNLLFQNYPECMFQLDKDAKPLVQDNTQQDPTVLDLLSKTADAFCSLDEFQAQFEFPEYSKTYLTFVVPQLCHWGSVKGRRLSQFHLNPKQLKQTFESRKVSLDWHCMQKC
jgi:hypothetical protein